MPELNHSKILETAMANNPLIQQAKLGIEIADINIKVAKMIPTAVKYLFLMIIILLLKS